MRECCYVSFRDGTTVVVFGGVPQTNIPPVAFFEIIKSTIQRNEDQTCRHASHPRPRQYESFQLRWYVVFKENHLILEDWVKCLFSYFSSLEICFSIISCCDHSTFGYFCHVVSHPLVLPPNRVLLRYHNLQQPALHRPWSSCCCKCMLRSFGSKSLGFPNFLERGHGWSRV